MASPLGSAPGIVVGVGLGTAAAAGIEPAIEIPRQDAWNTLPHRLLDPNLMARLVAQGGVSLEEAHADARREGYEKDKLNALVYLAQSVPGFAEALALWRRNPDSFADLWSHALVKAGIDARYLPFLNQLKDDRLSPPVIALAIVRGLMEAPFPLPFTPPAGVGKVAAFPTSNLDALDEAKAFGFNEQRLFVQTAISGRPMGPESAAAAFFKGILEHVDYQRAVLEGDVRGEWGDPILENARPIPHPLDFVQAHLRGWRTEPEMLAGAQRSGMVDADTELLFLIHGRPPSPHQVHIAYARGGRNAAFGDDERATFRKAVLESDVRPEWEPMLWAARYAMPSAFVLRALTSDGTFTETQSEGILIDSGWRPDLAKQAATLWAAKAGGTAATDPHVAKASTSLYTALHRSYVNRESDAGAVTPGLTKLGVPAAAQTEVLALWDLERQLIHAQLSPTQIRKAVAGAVTNQATGLPWSHADALAALLARGYSQADAETFLAE